VTYPPMGLVLVHKPAGQTSFRTLNYYKKYFNTKKIGHTGTLDMFATGLMLVLVGQATRLARYFVLANKSYRAEFCFGSQTDTLDPEGQVVKTAPIPDFSTIESILPQFRGEIQQVPPVYSAIHVQGKRAYERTLQGEVLDLAPRNVNIHDIRIVGFQNGRLTVDVDCSKGTYIRSLARDIAEACGSCAHVSALERTRVGPFDLAGAHNQFGLDSPQLIQGQRLLGAMDGLAGLIIDPLSEALIQQGKPFIPVSDAQHLALLSQDDRILAVMQRQSKHWSYDLVIPWTTTAPA
jgi:tRNA pseudouridine55 synthase